jgi:hypothetical protein
MSLFSGPEEHAANPPDSWKVQKSEPTNPNCRRWAVETAGGKRLSTFDTKKVAELWRSPVGFAGHLYAEESRWYAGEHIPGWRPYVARPSTNQQKEA